MNDKHQRPVIRVSEVMKKEFDTVDGLDTIANALKKMKHTSTKCLIVNKRHENDEYGVLLISDIARKVLAQDKAPDRINVYDHCRNIRCDEFLRLCNKERSELLG